MVLASSMDAGLAADGPVIARIDISPRDGGLQVEAMAIATAATAVTGKVSIVKHGPSGNMSINQQRDLTLADGESGSIGQTGLSFGPGDILMVDIVLSVGEETIASARSTVGAP